MMFSARGFFSSNGVKERDKIHCSSGEMPGSAGVGQNNSFTGQPHPLPGALSVQYERGGIFFRWSGSKSINIV